MAFDSKSPSFTTPPPTANDSAAAAPPAPPPEATAPVRPGTPGPLSPSSSSPGPLSPSSPEPGPASEPISAAVARFRSCRWRRPPENGSPECCGHRDVLPLAGTTGFNPESWCPDCAYYKLRRMPKKREGGY